MFPGRAPKRLLDVSHLFLSKNDSERSKGVTGGEAAVWLAIQGETLNRAHLAAGIATALASQGIHVTLLELGQGLPNVGYYFALEPAEYLALTLDESSVITGESGTFIRYSIAPSPGRFPTGDRKAPPADSPHVSLIAFTCPLAESYREFFTELGSTTASLGGTRDDGGTRAGSDSGNPSVGGNHSGEGMLLDGLMFMTDGGKPELDREVIDFIGGANPRTVVFVARPDGSTGDDYGADEIVILPSDITTTWVKRVPPMGPFFSDFTASFLQVISLRRRLERDAVV